MNECPHLTRLDAVADGTLPEAEAAAFEEHLSACPACLQALSELAANSLYPGSRRERGASPEPAEEQLLARLRQAWGRSDARRLDATSRSGDGSLGPEPAGRRFPFRVGAYEVVRRIGSGGMGVVYEARDTRLGRLVALKMLPPVVSYHVGERLRREAEVLAGLSHPHILPIHEVGEHEGQPYLALEWVAGGTLAERARATPQPPAEAAAVVRTLAGALQFAHDHGVIHRDLKPSNILIVASPRPSVARAEGEASALTTSKQQPATTVKVSDFGLARRSDDASLLTGTGQVLGTPGYMAPEQATGGKDVGPSTDVYGLGAILYELLTGRPPFQADSVALTLRMVQEVDPVAPRTLQPGVPRDLETICLKCLEKDSARRYASAEALGDDLGRFLEGRPIAARPMSTVGRTARWVRRHRGYALLGGLAVTLLLALAAGGVAYALNEARLRREIEDQQARADSTRTRAMQRFREAIDAFDAASRNWAVHEGQPELRRANFQALMKLCEAYLEYLPDASPQQPRDVYVLYRLGWMHGSIGESGKGERLYTEALAAVERLRPSFPDDPELHRLEFTSHLNRCYIRGNAGRWGEAEGDAAWAYAFARQRLPKAPGDVGALKEYIGAANNLHLCQFESGRKGESLDTLRDLIAVLRSHQPPRPESPADTRDLAHYLMRLGEVLSDLARPSEAVDPLGEAIDLLTPLVGDSRPDPDASRDFQAALRLRASAFEALGRSAEAELDKTRLNSSHEIKP